jgi:hypothetical protein
MWQKILYTILIAFITFSFNYAQKQNLSFFVKNLIKGERHETQAIGIGFPGEQWKYYLGFKKLATQKQLIRYCHHHNTIIKAYSFQALLDINIKEARKIYRKEETSGRTVKVFHGCTYNGSKNLFELYGLLIFSRFGSMISCHDGRPSEDEKVYFWFRQKTNDKIRDR